MPDVHGQQVRLVGNVHRPGAQRGLDDAHRGLVLDSAPRLQAAVVVTDEELSAGVARRRARERHVGAGIVVRVAQDRNVQQLDGGRRRKRRHLLADIARCAHGNLSQDLGI